jgi:transcriptional regulator with XRE-family HTH domain
MPRKRETALELWGKELACAREAAGMSGRQLADAINVAPSTLSQWETGKRTPHLSDVKRCEEKLGVNGYLTRLLVEWVSRETPTEWTEKWLAIEARAGTILSFELAVIPGLLQTEDYARAVLEFNRYAPFDIDEQVRSRLERQSILGQGDPPTCVFVMDEYVLRRQIGCRRTMYEQLTHLRQMAERRDIHLHIVPLDAGSYAGLVGPFMIAKFDGIEIAYQDGALSGHVLEGRDELSAIGRMWEDIRGAAISQAASIDLMEREIGKWTPG